MQVDRIMIGKFVGIEKTGIYSVAYSAAMAIMMLSSAVDGTLTPWIYKKIKGNEKEKISRVVSLVAIGIACVIMLLVLVAPEVIRILAPSSYREAIYVIPPVAASTLFITLYSFFGAIEFYYGENKFVLLASSIAAIAKIALNVILIPIIGYIAAGYTTLACYMLYALLHWFFMKRTIIKHAGIHSIFNDRLLLVVALSTCIISVLLTLLYGLPLIRYGIIVLMLLFFAIKRSEIVMIFKSVIPPRKEG
jgi:O-antigen/teichoic acid export membrane protein